MVGAEPRRSRRRAPTTVTVAPAADDAAAGGRRRPQPRRPLRRLGRRSSGSNPAAPAAATARRRSRRRRPLEPATNRPPARIRAARCARYLAEGAANAFFDTEIALFNPEATAAARAAAHPAGDAAAKWRGRSRCRREPGARCRRRCSRRSRPGRSRRRIESDGPVVVDRTMRWDATGYGAHAETAIEAPSTTWYLAEGSTSGDFALFYLLQNPGGAADRPRRCASCGRRRTRRSIAPTRSRRAPG